MQSSRNITLRVALLALALAAPVDFPAAAQSPAVSRRFLQLHQEYERLKATARWDDAGGHLQRIVDYVRANNMGLNVELSVVDQLALVRFNQGRYDESLEIYERVLNEGADLVHPTPQARDAFTPVMFNALVGIGRAHRYLGQTEQSLKYLRGAISYADANRLPSEAAQGRTEIALLLTEIGRAEEGIDFLKQAIPTLRRVAPDSTFLPNALHSLGYAYDQIGRHDLAEPCHRAALEGMVRLVGWNHNFTAVVADLYANSYQQQGRIAEAARIYRTVIAIYEQTVGRRHPNTAVAINNYARLIQFNSDQNERAESLAREALDIKREFHGDDHPQTAISMVNLANILWRQARHDEADPIARDAFEIYRRNYGIQHPESTKCLQLLSMINLSKGDPQPGLEFIDLALSVNDLVPAPPYDVAMHHAVRAIILQALDRHDDAAQAMDESLALIDLQRVYASGVEHDRARLLERNAIFYDAAIKHRADLKDPAAMFAIAETMKARSLLDELHLGNVDLRADIPEEIRAQLEHQEAALRRALTDAQARYDDLPPIAENPSHRDAEARTAATRAIFDARSALADHLAAIKSASPTYRDLITHQSETTTLNALQQTMADDELALAYLVGGDHSYVITIRADEVSFTELLLDETTASLLDLEVGPLSRNRLHQILTDDAGILPALSSPNDLPADLHRRLATLFRLLIPEEVRQPLATGDISRLTIFPSASLALLPFETLVTSIDDGDPTYLLDVGPPINYAPSATVLLNLAARPDASANQTVLTLGDPAYDEPSPDQDSVARMMQSVGARNQFRAGLGRLPFSGWEAEWVQDHFEKAGLQTTRLTGRDATESAFRRAVAGQNIVHLACHGLADETHSNLFGALALTPGRSNDPDDDGFLNMSEIYDLALDDCELAILSACQTNYGPQQTGEGVWALSRGFLVAGARRVVASNWIVDDRACATLVSYLASILAKQDVAGDRHDYAAALHKAKQLVRNTDDWQHPFYWSSLVLVGPN